MNNSENNNNGFNVPVGNNINQIPVPEPIEMIDTLDDEVSVVNQMPVNSNTSLPVDPVVAPVEPLEPIVQQTQIPEPINNFNTVSSFNDIGTVPPISNLPSDTPKNKGGINKILFVIIIVLALTAVGVGVYIFLHMANKSNVVTKTMNIELGTDVSTNLNDYAVFNNVDPSTCSLDTTNITDTSRLNAEYTFKVICGENTYTGTAKIVDTIAPKVEVKEVNVATGKSIKAEDFIESVDDASKCSYVFKDEDLINEYMKKEANYHVDIIVKDEAGNETTVTGTLIVNNTVADLYLVCSGVINTKNVTDKLGLVDSQFNKLANRIYSFSFNNENEYNTFKKNNESKSEVTYNNITGEPTFNDDTKTLDIAVVISYDSLNSEFNTTLPLSYGELRSFYEKEGFSCNIGY